MVEENEVWLATRSQIYSRRGTRLVYRQRCYHTYAPIWLCVHPQASSASFSNVRMTPTTLATIASAGVSRPTI